MADDFFEGTWGGDVARGARGDALGSSGSIWDMIVCGVIYISGRMFLHWANPYVCERLGVPVDSFWGCALSAWIVVGLWVAVHVIKWAVFDIPREIRESAEASALAAAKAIERQEIEQARIAREARFKAGHKLP